MQILDIFYVKVINDKNEKNSQRGNGIDIQTSFDGSWGTLENCDNISISTFYDIFFISLLLSYDTHQNLFNFISKLFHNSHAIFE